jgi:glyoxylase-like metal-dependent hydrolase (beta-lactamase superfamily II)
MLKVHQYQSRPEGFAVNSWLIEAKQSLILIDCQFLVYETTALLEKITRLNKPLEAIFITHPHPDHFNGAGIIAKAFPDARIIATRKTTEGILGCDGPKREFWTPIYKGDYPPSTKYPTERLESGDSVEVAGIKFTLEDVGAGECENLSTIFLPEEQTLFSSDLIYNRAHPWLAEGRSIAWLAQVAAALAKYKRVVRIFPGHGDETTLAGFNAIMIYICRFQQLIREHAADEDVLKLMKAEFVSYSLENLLAYNIPAVRKELNG